MYKLSLVPELEGSSEIGMCSLSFSSMKRSAVALLLLLIFAPGASTQSALPLPVSVEVRAGAGIPLGEFTEAEPGIGAEPGPHLRIAGLWRFTAGLAGYLGYARSWFGCAQCRAVGIDDRVVDTGFDGGVEVSLPVRLSRVQPWVSAGAVFHQLVFSGEGSSLSSDRALGFRLAGGAAVPLRRSLAVKPGVSYSAYSAELELGAFSDQTVGVTYLTVDVGLVYRF